MDFFSHFLIGIIISIFTLNKLSLSIILYAGVMSVLADFDIILAPLQLIKKSNLLAHKGISHSFFYAAIVTAITGSVFSIITGEQFFLAWVIGFLFYSMHNILDFLTASKIPIFYPLSKKRYRFFIDRAINIFLATISGSIILFYFIIFFLWPKLFFSNMVNYIFGFYVVYFTYRFLTKIWVQFRLPKNRHYIPGILPFTYLIYGYKKSEEKISFKLIKKSQFRSKKSKLIESDIKLLSNEMKLFEKAVLLSKKYSFFSKWEFIIPIIKKDEKNIIVILFLAESFTSGHVYHLKIVFDLVKNERVNEVEGFNYRVKS
ncbi:MAG: metal-dependent hydrolase, partial [Promethearchaeota archaeon]